MLVFWILLHSCYVALDFLLVYILFNSTWWSSWSWWCVWACQHKILFLFQYPASVSAVTEIVCNVYLQCLDGWLILCGVFTFSKSFEYMFMQFRCFTLKCAFLLCFKFVLFKFWFRIGFFGCLPGFILLGFIFFSRDVRWLEYSVFRMLFHARYRFLAWQNLSSIILRHLQYYRGSGNYWWFELCLLFEFPLVVVNYFLIAAHALVGTVLATDLVGLWFGWVVMSARQFDLLLMTLYVYESFM